MADEADDEAEPTASTSLPDDLDDPEGVEFAKDAGEDDGDSEG